MAIDLEALSNNLRDASNGIVKSLRHSQSPPDLLFHYTNATGMLGILNSSRIWATNYRFLNDSSEINYGLVLFETIVQERILQSDSEVINEFLRESLNATKIFDGCFDCYVACFCENDDLLNQWRVYASSGGGFAIGFQASQLIVTPENMEHQGQAFYLRKIVYDELIQRKLFDDAIDVVAEQLATYTDSMNVVEAQKAIETCCSQLTCMVAEYFMFLKHPAFAVEQEWRLCHLTEPHYESHVCYRDGLYGLTPYACLDPCFENGENRGKLPLGRITHSPAKEPRNVRYALSMMLKEMGYGNVDIYGSKLPVRV